MRYFIEMVWTDSTDGTIHNTRKAINPQSHAHAIEWLRESAESHIDSPGFEDATFWLEQDLDSEIKTVACITARPSEGTLSPIKSY